MQTVISQNRRPAHNGAILGVALAAAVAACAVGVHTLPRVGIFSALILAIVLGMVVGNTMTIPAAWRTGTQFCLKRVLRL